MTGVQTCALPICLRLDISRMKFPDSFFADMAPRMARAYDAMDHLEIGRASCRERVSFTV